MECDIRLAVIMRKVIQGNRSEKGTQTQAVLLTIFCTQKRRGQESALTLIQGQAVLLNPSPMRNFRFSCCILLTATRGNVLLTRLALQEKIESELVNGKERFDTGRPVVLSLAMIDGLLKPITRNIQKSADVQVIAFFA